MAKLDGPGVPSPSLLPPADSRLAGMSVIALAIGGVTRQISSANTITNSRVTIVKAEHPMRRGGLYKGYSSGSNGNRGRGVSTDIWVWTSLCSFA